MLRDIFMFKMDSDMGNLKCPLNIFFASNNYYQRFNIYKAVKFNLNFKMM